MVPAALLRNAIDQLDKWSPDLGANITWVNWRQGFQVKMSWYGAAAFACYLDFGRDRVARDSVLKAVFERFAPAGQKPRVEKGHGWTALDFSLRSKKYICLNDVIEIARSMGHQFTVIYVQECISSRPIFETMGIALVPGEMGKELINGEFVSYSTPLGMCL